MPIRPPALDDRRHDDLVAELLARIPAHTPEWTHPRPGDPGRTLIDLFAWLADTVLYRANLIPERQRLAYLRLVGGALRPAQPARGLVALNVKADRSVVALQVPAGATIAKPEAFSTQDFCTAYPLQGRALIKRRLTPGEEVQFNALLPDLQAVYTGTEGTPQGYVTTEVFAPGQPLDEGIDIVGTSVDRSLWIALLAPSAKQRDAAYATLGADLQGTARALNVGLALALDRPDPLEPLKPPAPLPARWAMSTGSDASTPEVPDFVVLETLEDGTRDLTQSGVLRLALPALAAIGAPPNDPRENLKAGVGDAPPRLENEDDAARLVTWLRLTPGPEVLSLRLAWAGVHAVRVLQRQALPARALGVSDGGSDQSLALGVTTLGSPDPATLKLIVQDGITGTREWKPLDDLGRAGPLDEAYRLDAEAGTVHFGDGVHGRVPSTGSRIVADGLWVGGGARGNLPPGSLAKIDQLTVLDTGQRRKPDPGIDVWQPLALADGADAETLDAAERRIPAVFRHRDRAVTAEDYRQLALDTPGADVARVEVLPRFKPHERVQNVPGVVSVMVWPARATTDWAAPLPRAGRPLLEAVHAQLNPRRPLAAELYVIGCEYRPLGASVAVLVREGHAREQVLTDVRLAIRRHLWALDGEGTVAYPLGRTLSDRELEVIVARVPGVAGVSPVRLFAPDEQGRWVELPGVGKAVTRFTLEAWQLPELAALSVVEGVDAPASPLSGFDAGEGDGGANVSSLYLPVVPELC